ncbi:hypothetical protein QFZ32_006274 [Streptomyces canus]|uniref:DUF418 domain-containing protein n=1 Tax=Streptomyces canus TaxID=58343 RepID=A0AAW8FLI8_9ACTN|nr:hypothetical protein [Streptomyces canus]MDQ0910813.1 hypothetical protein [Streptomyces canus]MDQ1070834.1 hypothetical protein [Streptomyces canus]
MLATLHGVGGTLLPVTISGALYVGTIATVALTAVLARSPGRRRDAREALKVLLWRRGGSQ